MKKVVHLFASQRVNRKARTDNEEVFREKVTLITNKQISTGKLVDFTQLVKDMGVCGIVIGNNRIALKADQVMVKNGNDEAAMFQGGKLNANLIDAKKIVAQGIDAKSVVAEGLKAGDIDAERATIRNLNIIFIQQFEKGCNKIVLMSDCCQRSYRYT